MIYGCANQLPPSGGKEDKEPPKVFLKSPAVNTVDFSGNGITIEFDKYVDQRSFQDAFRISPPFTGEVDFNWSGKEVEVVFEKPFQKIDSNKTYVVNISTSFKDIHGNSLSKPVSFAFSTGLKIDTAGISGKVYNNNGKNISIFAYKIFAPDTSYNPSEKKADYITETSSEGEYELTNLSSGKYRVIAVDDDDKNLLYTTDRESYGVLPFDITLYDSSYLKDVNFFLKDIKKVQLKGNIPDISEYFKDSLEIVYSSIEDKYKNVVPEQSIFLFFKKFKPSREELVRSLHIMDENKNSIKILFNWLNDSLVEIFPPEKYNFNSKYTLSFVIKIANDSTYNYILNYSIISPNSYGELKGVIRRTGIDSLGRPSPELPVVVKLTSFDLKPQVRYTFTIKDSAIDLKNILEADYSVFSFIDQNGDDEYNYGYPFPFKPSEPFYVYPQKVSIRGGWAVENLILELDR